MNVGRMFQRLLVALLGALSIMIAAISAHAADAQPAAPSGSDVQPGPRDAQQPAPPEVPAAN